MSTYLLKTLGCKANVYDSQRIEKELQDLGWSPDAKNEPKLCIINSCTVTEEANRQTKKTASQLARKHPDACIVITGCAAEVAPTELAKTPGTHFVIGNQDKNRLVDLVLEKLSLFADDPKKKQGEILGSVIEYQELLSQHPTERIWPFLDSFKTPAEEGHTKKTRAFLKIQEGCNSFCTYCIIPYARGPSRNPSPQMLVEQVKSLLEQGIQEVILTGTNIGDYSFRENQKNLEDLIEIILEKTALPRLRLSSLDPTEITPKILHLMEENTRLCGHFHVSLQSPHSKILRLMKRRYRFSEVEHTLQSIANLSKNYPLTGGIFVGMDVITGFPGETDEDFEWTQKALESLPWTRLHVFPYSERHQTPASRLPHLVEPKLRMQRSKILIDMSMQRLTEYYRSILHELKTKTLDNVLMERQGVKTWISGYTTNYIRVLVPAYTHKTNELVSVQPHDFIIDTQKNDVALIAS